MYVQWVPLPLFSEVMFLQIFFSLLFLVLHNLMIIHATICISWLMIYCFNKENREWILLEISISITLALVCPAWFVFVFSLQNRYLTSCNYSLQSIKWKIYFHTRFSLATGQNKSAQVSGMNSTSNIPGNLDNSGGSRKCIRGGVGWGQ